MKIWQTEYTFQHNWATVVQANAKKYPNTYNSSVASVDVMERNLDQKTGIMHTNKLFQTYFGLTKFYFASEHSTIDPRRKRMTMCTRNITLSSYCTSLERMEFTPHPDNKDWTLVKQSFEVDSDFFTENVLFRSTKANCLKGQAAIEWVVNEKLPPELKEYLQKPVVIPS